MNEQRDDLLEKVSDVIWQGMLPGHEHVSQLREPANATARHIIALVKRHRDEEIREALLSDEGIDAAREGWSAAWKHASDQTCLIEAMVKAQISYIGLDEEAQS